LTIHASRPCKILRATGVLQTRVIYITMPNTSLTKGCRIPTIQLFNWDIGGGMKESEICMKSGSLLPVPQYGNFCHILSGSFVEVFS